MRFGCILLDLDDGYVFWLDDACEFWPGFFGRCVVMAETASSGLMMVVVNSCGCLVIVDSVDAFLGVLR